MTINPPVFDRSRVKVTPAAALAEDDAATKPRITDSNAPRLKAFSGLADKETTAPLDVEYVTESKE